MEKSNLASEYREESGKGVARRLRMVGKVPAVVYGKDEDAIAISINESEVRKIMQAHGESALIDLKVTGKVKKSINTIIRDIQFHPTTEKILHVDFQKIRLDEKIRVDVQVHLKGDPKGVKESGGILEHGIRNLTIMCVPTDIPESIEADVSELEINSSIHVSDILDKYPQLEIQDDPDTTLAIVVPPKVEVEPVAEVEEEEGAEEPELISKEKKEGEEEAKEAKEGKEGKEAPKEK